MDNSTFSLTCACGGLRGELKINPVFGQRVVCMCADCQAFAHFLSLQDALLDENGGTEVYQTTPSAITITKGANNLACMRLSQKGLMRWYASCCNSPVANTAPSAGLPFASLLIKFIRLDSEDARYTALGPIRVRVNAREGYGTPPPQAHATVPKGFLLKSGLRLLRAKLKGQARPSAFFEPASGDPIATPKVLSSDERAAL